MPTATPADVSLGGRPVWVVGVPYEGGSVWFVTLDDGDVRAFAATPEGVRPYPWNRRQFRALAPPVVTVAPGREPTLLRPLNIAESPLSHPVPVADTGNAYAYIRQNGSLSIFLAGVEGVPFAVNAPPDARIATDGTGRLLLLGGATDRYPHGALGDDIEASTLILVTYANGGRVVRTISVPEPAVIEGIMPIWTDADGDGEREILVTVSDATRGARLVLYGEDGAVRATGPETGGGNRWRHQIAVAPFGPGGEREIADVLTPHIGGVAEWFRVEGDTLRCVASLPGYSSHAFGSRNLDMACAADADGDGRVELVVPTQDRTAFGGLRREGDGAFAAWMAPLGGVLATNLAAVSLPNGTLAFAAGRDDGTLRFWLPA